MNEKTITTEEIWRLLSEKLRSFFAKRVSSEEIAEDLLQETFIRIHSKLNTLDDRQRFTAWVFQMARNILVDHYRSKAGELQAQEFEDCPEESTGEENLNELLIDWLPSMIEKLPDLYRPAVELYELKRMPQQQIADQLDISLSAAKSRVQRGREKLKSLLLDCCIFEQDRRGNVIECQPLNEVEKACNICDIECDN